MDEHSGASPASPKAHDWLADRFQEHRTRLRAVAYRMLGSIAEADDAVQEAWLRLSRADTSGVDNFAGWLTTVVARVCLNMLRSRGTRREEPLEALAFAHPSRLVHPALVNGAAGVVVTADGQPISVWGFTVTDGKIVSFDVLGDPARLAHLDLAAFSGGPG